MSSSLGHETASDSVTMSNLEKIGSDDESAWYNELWVWFGLALVLGVVIGYFVGGNNDA